MPLGRNFTFALDDSGGVEPLLDRRRAFFPGDHPFFLVASVGLNDDLLPAFESAWQDLREDIARTLRADHLPSLHARLMFGDRKPPSYRGRPNPYLGASRQDVLGWHRRGVQLVGRFLRKRDGGAVFTVVLDRAESGRAWEEIFRQPLALAEGEYLKLAHRQRFPRLHQKYVAHVAGALTMPTLDQFMAIQETMRQRGARASILLDGYSDADGFNEDAALGFVSQHLNLSLLGSVRLPDTDSEALCQAADLIAYSTFRFHLARYRSVPPEDWVQECVRVLDAPPLCAVDIPAWLRRHRSEPEVRAVYNAARYGIAHHEISRYAPDIAQHDLKTPEEFLDDCRKIPAASLESGRNDLYLPILKADVLRRWQAARTQNGEDRSESGPVAPE